MYMCDKDIGKVILPCNFLYLNIGYCIEVCICVYDENLYTRHRRSYVLRCNLPRNTAGRTFYISRNHGGCDIDKGWVTIKADANSGCLQWDNLPNAPGFLYSPKNTYCHWAAEGEHGM